MRLPNRLSWPEFELWRLILSRNKDHELSMDTGQSGDDVPISISLTD